MSQFPYSSILQCLFQCVHSDVLVLTRKVHRVHFEEGWASLCIMLCDCFSPVSANKNFSISQKKQVKITSPSMFFPNACPNRVLVNSLAFFGSSLSLNSSVIPSRHSWELTFLHLFPPDLDSCLRMSSVMNEPQRQRLDTLLRACQVIELLLQRRPRKGRHRAPVSWNFFLVNYSVRATWQKHERSEKALSGNQLATMRSFSAEPGRANSTDPSRFAIGTLVGWLLVTVF